MVRVRVRVSFCAVETMQSRRARGSHAGGAGNVGQAPGAQAIEQARPGFQAARVPLRYPLRAPLYYLPLRAQLGGPPRSGWASAAVGGWAGGVGCGCEQGHF